jgi:hypothetical protein
MRLLVLQTDQVVASFGCREQRVDERLEYRIESDVRTLLVFEDFHRSVYVKVEAAVLRERLHVGICFALKKRLKLERPTRDTYLVLFEVTQGQSFV